MICAKCKTFFLQVEDCGPRTGGGPPPAGLGPEQALAQIVLGIEELFTGGETTVLFRGGVRSEVVESKKLQALLDLGRVATLTVAQATEKRTT